MLAAINEAKFKVSDEGRPKAVEKQHSLGKLTARERIAALVEPGSFIEYGMLITPPAAETEAMRGAECPADGIVCGIGKVDGRSTVIISGDFTVMGGSGGSTALAKVNRLMKMAMEKGLPMISIGDGGGHRIQEGLDSRHFASAGSMDFFNMGAKMTGWVPSVYPMMGPGFAGPSMFAASSDFVPMVKGMSTMGVAGPPLVKRALGTVITSEELGGSKYHCEVTGMADLEVESEEACFAVTKQFLSYFPSNASQNPPVVKVDDPADRRDEWLLDAVPESRTKPYDMHSIISTIADKDSIFEMKPKFARNVLTMLGRMDGRPVGFLANNPKFMGGVLDVKACKKMSKFINLCDAYNLPLIYFIDTSGFLPGPKSEAEGIIRYSARVLFELGMSSVTKIAVVTGKAYGGAYSGMCGGRSFNADYTVGWPTAEFCAMGIEGAVDVAYGRVIAKAEDPEAKRKEIVEGFREHINPLAGASGFGVDDIIDPRDTRRLINQTIDTVGLESKGFVPPRKRGIAPI